MGLWKPDEAQTLYITNLQDPIIVREYEARKKQLGLTRYSDGLFGRARRDFDRDMVAKYGEQYPPPGRTPWLFKIWDMLEASGQI